MWHDLLTAFALMLVIEGILPFINPEALRRTLLQVAQLDARVLRIGALVSMVSGVVLLYLVR
ncbi:MAG: hypothetical protein B7Z66_04120 [Chromatiales bacterium 21-64-14]|nr:MAG: hypothetical protein B7Z66_04120 [Chromatiales bacterium 21-64-14]HQU14735.1 DUF2065 domain-containing protein [Gammaproteobacteria bacterium]